MKELKSEDTNPTFDLVDRFWRYADHIRGSIPFRDTHFLFYLLFLQKQGILDRLIQISPHDPKKYFFLAIAQFDGEFGDEIRTISKFYLPIISRIEDAVLNDIVQFYFVAFKRETLALHYSELFEVLLYRYVTLQGRMAEEIMLPVELSRFVAKLADPPANAKVYNPFAGLASFGIFLNNTADYIGQEINEATWALGSLRILAHQREGNTNFLLGDSINYWHPKSKERKFFLDDNSTYPSVKEKFDVIIADPPFGETISETLPGYFGHIRTYEHFLIERGLDDLKEDGKIIALLSQSFLSRGGSEQNLRQHLVKQDLLETVILFPDGLLFSTSIALVCVVINRRKKLKGVVRFINAKKCFTSSGKSKRLDEIELNRIVESNVESGYLRIVSNEDIGLVDYNLSVARYFSKEYDGVLLKELTFFIKGTRGNGGQAGKFVRIRNLKDDALEYQLSLPDIEESEIPKSAQKITESCLLMATRWKTLKPTYFNFTGVPIYITSEIVAFTVDEAKCDIAYLINELHSKDVIEQVETYRIGTITAVIRIEDLFSVRISLPDLDKQKAIVKQRMMDLANEKKKELLLFNKIHGLEAEIIEQNTYLRHVLAGPSSNLKDSISNIKKIIADRVVAKHPEILQLKISEKHLMTLGAYLEIIERDANKIVNAVASQLKAEIGIEEKKLAPVEIIGFLERYAVEYNERENLNFKIDFDYDREFFVEDGHRIKTYISANEDLLRDLFDNLTNNAHKHAFTQEENNRIEIFLRINSEDEEQDEVQILFSNTGKPFPEEFTIHEFVRKGAKFGDTAGDGFGGWYINEIIKKLNGTVAIIPETGNEGLPGSDLVTNFEINFPIIETDDNEQV